MKSSTIAAAAFISAAHVMAAERRDQKGVPAPSVVPKPGQKTSAGCWGAPGDWTQQPKLDYLSSGSCGDACLAGNFNVYALKGSACLCGDNYPPEGTEVDLNKCNYPCPGFDLEACGTLGTPGFYSVFLTGLEVDIPSKEAQQTTTSSPPTAVITDEVLVPTSNAPPPAEESPVESGGSNSVGIAVGVVLGVLLIAAAAGGGWFWLRRKRRQEEEEERRRAEAVNAFVGGHKSGSDNGSFADSRLDPVMVHRRMSDGSIADNHDYSRKILRVTNA